MIVYMYYAHCSHSLSTLWVGWRVSLWGVHCLHYALLTVYSLSTLVTSQCYPTMCNRTCAGPSQRVCHRATMVNEPGGHIVSWFYVVQLSNLNIINDCTYILRSLLMQFEHSMGWVESFFMRRSLLALCIAHCLQFEHCGDFTMQSYNV